MEYANLKDENKMPVLGFGAYRIPPDKTKEAVLVALRNGYRLIDTAEFYQNEQGVGDAVKESGIKREEIFITSKVFPNRFGYKKTKKALAKTLSSLGTDYIDLMLLHQPFGNVNGAWKALIEAQQEGKVKSIGVSNFSTKQVDKLTKISGVMPVLNQIEISPFYQRDDEVKILQTKGIQVESWASFANGRHNIFDNEILVAIGKKYNKTSDKVILRWLIQRKIIAIPKSITPSRIKANIEVFDFNLSAEDMMVISKLDLRKSQFPGMKSGLFLMKLFYLGRNGRFKK